MAVVRGRVVHLHAENYEQNISTHVCSSQLRGPNSSTIPERILCISFLPPRFHKFECNTTSDFTTTALHNIHSV